jgi:phenylalanyl-tRNA synthetase beta chain
MGGGNSEVTEQTTRLLLESAYFQPGGIRRTARRHGLHTEASHRFERGADLEALPMALDRAAAMIAELAGGKVLAGCIDVYPNPVARRRVTLRLSRLEALLGTPVPAAEAVRILSALGFGVETSSADALTVSVPARRPDVDREEDLIEEVARIRGYDQIPASMPHVAASRPAESRSEAVERRLRTAATAAGLSEVLNYSFVSEKELQAVDPHRILGNPIPLRNPLSAEQSVMRTSLLPGLLQNLSLSLRHQSLDVRLYELGRVYRPGMGAGRSQPAVEELRLAGVLTGRRAGVSWNAPKENVDFYDAKGAVEDLLQAVGARATFDPARDHAALHPRAAAWVTAGDRRLGAVGELHPRVAEKLNVPPGIFAFDLDATALEEVSVRVPTYGGLPRFPAVLRDLAVVLEDKVEAATVVRAVRVAGGGLVEEVLLFDVYRGAPIPAGRKSLALAIRYRAPDRTLTDAEAIAAHERIVVALAREVGAELRA